jgi:hypothetical protein
MGKPELEVILRHWAAKNEEVSPLEIIKVKFDFDPGWNGTDVTPGDPPELSVSYDVVQHRVITIPMNEVGPFIEQLAEIRYREVSG